MSESDLQMDAWRDTPIDSEFIPSKSYFANPMEKLLAAESVTIHSEYEY